VAEVLSHVSADSMMGLDSGSVGSSLTVDGSSVVVVGTSESGMGRSSSSSGGVSGGSRNAFSSLSVFVESDGLLHAEVGVIVNLGSVDSLTVGTFVLLFGIVSSVRVESHLGDELLDVSSGSLPFSVPGFESGACAILVLDGIAEVGVSDLVVLGGFHLGLESFLHHSPGKLVCFDGLGVSLDLVPVGSVPSHDESVAGSSSVSGIEVLVGLDESTSHELHVAAEVSHAGGLGFFEGTHGVKEGVVAEISMGGGGVLRYLHLGKPPVIGKLSVMLQ